MGPGSELLAGAARRLRPGAIQRGRPSPAPDAHCYPSVHSEPRPRRPRPGFPGGGPLRRPGRKEDPGPSGLGPGGSDATKAPNVTPCPAIPRPPRAGTPLSGDTGARVGSPDVTPPPKGASRAWPRRGARPRAASPVAACAGPAPVPRALSPGAARPRGPPAPRVPGSRAAAPARRVPRGGAGLPPPTGRAHKAPLRPTERPAPPPPPAPRTHSAPERAGPPATRDPRSPVPGRPDPAAARAPTLRSASAICAPRPPRHTKQGPGSSAPLPGLARRPRRPAARARCSPRAAHSGALGLALRLRGPEAREAMGSGSAAARRAGRRGGRAPPPRAGARAAVGGLLRSPPGRAARAPVRLSRPSRGRGGTGTGPAAHPDAPPVAAGSAPPGAQRRERLGVGAAGGAGGKSSRAAWLRSPAPRRPQGRARPDSTPWRPACPLRARRRPRALREGGLAVGPSGALQKFMLRLRLGDAAGRGWGDRCTRDQRLWADAPLSGAPRLWPVL